LGSFASSAPFVADLFRDSVRGTVTLVALCFVAVLGITLAGYIAVCSRAMNLSNRSFQARTSQQLAELGVDEALRAFNKNDWTDWSSSPTNISTSGAWTLDTTNHRASRTITFNSPKLGQGVTGTVKIRIDNYDAAVLGSSWVSSGTYPSYRINDLVGYNGIWYVCVKNHATSQTPGISNLTYWVPAPIPWTWETTTTYKNYDVVNYNGTWYRYINGTPTSGNLPTNTTYWTSIGAIRLYNAGQFHASGEIVYAATTNPTWYLCTSSGTPGNFSASPLISWQYLSSTTYSFNDVVYHYSGGVYNWYRFINATPTSGITPGSNASYWENGLSGAMSGWSSGIKYNLGDAVYYSTTSQWYRCILAHTSSGSITPSSTTYWTNTPLYSTAWDSNRQYSSNDTVRYNGQWYLALSNNSATLPTNTTYWIGANAANASYQWNASTAYSVGNYRNYGGVWYKCITANTGQSPNDTAYWTPTWANSWGVTTGAPVVYAEGTITIANNPPARTQLRATIAPAPLFPNAVAATTTISANSGGTVDSYDSTTGTSALQTGVTGTAGTSNTITGSYASQVGTATNYSAVVAAGNTSSTAITLSTTAVKGYLAAPSSSTSPYAPLYSSGGSVKSSTSPASPNIDLSRISRSPSIPQFDTLPGGAGGVAANWATIPKGTQLSLTSTTNIGTPGATTPARYYYNGNLTIGSASIQYLKINGPVILYVNGDLFISNPSSNGRIDIASAASAEIHVTGAFKADAGGEGIQNYTADPKSLIIICDTTANTTHYYSEGVNDLYGVIYAPYTGTTGSYYNDNNATEIFGAISATKILYSGANLNVHYDTSLRYATFGGVDQPYTVTDWREIPVDEQATMP
jgi:hypothetical protein